MAAGLSSPVSTSARNTRPAYTYGEERDSEFIDELIRISEDKRTEALGPNYFEFAREFFLFRPSSWQPQLDYQVRLRMPELLTMILQESFELAEPQPVFFIERGGERQTPRERALKINWQSTGSQMQLFLAEIWSMICHTGFVQVQVSGGSPRKVQLLARNPQNVYPDPFATDWHDWEYVLVRVPMAPDEVVRRFPWVADRLPGVMAQEQREMAAQSRMGGVIGSGPESIELPPGAMQSVMIGRPPGTADFLSVDYLFIKDEARESVAREVAGSKAAGKVLPPPSTIAKYPTGRLMVRIAKLKCYDGMNQYRRFPILPIFSHPPLYGVWGTPPLQLYIQMQHLAESMTSQNAENMIRMNYGYRVYQDGSILNPEALDKLGGNIRVKTADDVSKVLRILNPPQMSPGQNAFPNEILQHMRDLFGRTQQRQGNIGAGNVSPGLMDAAVEQAEAITRMRATLLGQSTEEIGRLEFETMVDYVDDTTITGSLNGSFQTAPWEGVPIEQILGWNVSLDTASVRPISAGALKRLALPLINLGLPMDIALEWMQVPDAERIGGRIREEKRQQMLMALLQAQQKKSGGRSKT